MRKTQNQQAQAFYQAIMTLDSPQACKSFLEDVCTLKELQALIQRYAVAKLLYEGKNYQEVSEETGASSATISRVNRCLQTGKGYVQVLKKEKKG